MPLMHLYTSTLRNVFSDRPKTAAVCDDGSRKFLGRTSDRLLKTILWVHSAIDSGNF